MESVNYEKEREKTRGSWCVFFSSSLSNFRAVPTAWNRLMQTEKKIYDTTSTAMKLLRRLPLNVRAVSAKIKLPKKYLQHCHILRTDKKKFSLLLLPS